MDCKKWLGWMGSKKKLLPFSVSTSALCVQQQLCCPGKWLSEKQKSPRSVYVHLLKVEVLFRQHSHHYLLVNIYSRNCSKLFLSCKSLWLSRYCGDGFSILNTIKYITFLWEDLNIFSTSFCSVPISLDKRKVFPPMLRHGWNNAWQGGCTCTERCNMIYFVGCFC